MALTDARLFHVNVNCSDLDRSRRFYVDALGLTVGAHTATEQPQPGTAFGLDKARWDAWILLGARGYEGGAVDLLEWQEPLPTGTPPATFTECGWHRCGFRVTDLEAAITRVRDLGGSVWSEPLEHVANGNVAHGNTIRIVMANDPDGTAIELIEGDAFGLSFVAVCCADLDRSHAFYNGLGFREVARFSSERDDAAHLRVAGPVAIDEIVLAPPGGGDVIVILVGFRTPATVTRAPRPANALGMWRTAFLVTDLDPACAELDRRQVATISPPVTMAMGPGLPDLRFVCFAGPDGEVLELIEQPA